MIDLTIEQIRAAAANDLTAIADVLQAMEPRIGQVANRYGNHAGGKILNAELREELVQEGRIAVWQCIERFTGDSVAMFFTYVDRTLTGVMDDFRRRETRQGVSEDTARRFERCITECSGDPYKAEQEAQRADGVLGTQRMTPETAYAARAAWQGCEYLDTPMKNEGETDESMTLADRLVQEGYLTVEADLATAGDIDAGRRKAIREAVHATLDRMGKQHVFVLKATYGISPVPPMDSDREIAEALGIPEKRITAVRCRAKDRFRELYLKGARATYTAAA